MFLLPRWIFILWLLTFYAVWLFLMTTTESGFDLFLERWIYPIMMMAGATVAGATPMGGGSVAFPVLSLYFDIDVETAKNFSLMIQSIGMTSAAIVVLSRRPHSRQWFKNLFVYIAISYLGFITGNIFYGIVNLDLIKILFLSLALSFIANFILTHNSGHDREIDHSIDGFGDWQIVSLTCFLGGVCSAFFGNGADMLIYIALVLFWHIREREGIDISIVVMAAISVMGTFTNYFVFDTITHDVYLSWLVAAPIVIVFAPLGNVLLHRIPERAMLIAVLILCFTNFVYYIATSPDSLILSLITLFSFFTIFYTIDRTQRILKA